jgi:hypothetical protein
MDSAAASSSALGLMFAAAPQMEGDSAASLHLLFAISERMLVEDAARAQFVAAAKLLRSHHICRASPRLLAEA